MEGEEYIKGSSVAGLICCIIQYSSQGGPGGPVAETLLPVQGAWVRFLVRELNLTCHN